MSDDSTLQKWSRREWFGAVSKAAAASKVVAPLLGSAILACGSTGDAAPDTPPLNGIAGVDRITVLQGKTYLRGWAGYGDPPRPGRPQGGRGAQPEAPPPPPGPTPTAMWSKESGTGAVTFADATALQTTAKFSALGAYVLKLTVSNGQATHSSTLNVSVEAPPPDRKLDAVYTKEFKISSRLWNARAKALIVNWIPHCIDQMNRTDLTIGEGGLDNFIEAGKALRGESHGQHKGYVFSNAWVHQTVEAMSIALMMDPQGDPEILAAFDKFHKTLDAWIPIILAAQEPDGYLQTAFTVPTPRRPRGADPDSPPVIPVLKHWDPASRGNHEGYTGGYFLESAINHYQMTRKQDARLYNAAKKLADCWYNNLGPAPKKPWFDGHQEMEQALVRFGRFVNDNEGGGKGDKYIALAKFLLDCRYNAAVVLRQGPDGPVYDDRTEYDQSHLPVIEQYEAVGHAVRAMYTYSGMADVAVETHDPDYQSAVKSLWDNVVNKKYYVTGGVGSGETSEGFGGNYSLGNHAYCEACSSCGEIFFHWKMNLAYHDAKYVDLYEQVMYNALLGATDLEAKNYFYDNPLDEHKVRYAWHVCPCCVGNIARTLLMFPTWTYAKAPDGVYVNLYVGSTINLENVAGTDVEMVQSTDYPWKGNVAITVNPKTPKNFTVRIRVPDRGVSKLYPASPDANGILSLSVNGSAVKPVIENGYAVIARNWKAGDRIEANFPLKVQRVRADERLTADRGKVTLKYGPMLYNFEQVDNGDLAGKSLSPDSPLTTEWRADLLNGVMVIKGNFSDGSPLMAVPNFARMNRGPVPPQPPPPPANLQPGQRPPRQPEPPATSSVWIKEA